MIEKLKNKYGVFDLFIDNENSKYYLTPGPLQKNGNYEYTISVQNDKLYTLTEKEIKEFRKNSEEIYQGIKEGKIVMFVPSGRYYQLGILLKEDKNNNTIELIGRPNNAIGKSLKFIKIEIPNKQSFFSNVENFLNSFENWEIVQAFFKGFNNKETNFDRFPYEIRIKKLEELNIINILKKVRSLKYIEKEYQKFLKQIEKEIKKIAEYEENIEERTKTGLKKNNIVLKKENKLYNNLTMTMLENKRKDFEIIYGKEKILKDLKDIIENNINNIKDLKIKTKVKNIIKEITKKLKLIIENQQKEKYEENTQPTI